MQKGPRPETKWVLYTACNRKQIHELHTSWKLIFQQDLTRSPTSKLPIHQGFFSQHPSGTPFSASQEIGLEERLRNDLLCVEWDVKLTELYPYRPTIYYFVGDKRIKSSGVVTSRRLSQPEPPTYRSPKAQLNDNKKLVNRTKLNEQKSTRTAVTSYTLDWDCRNFTYSKNLAPRRSCWT